MVFNSNVTLGYSGLMVFVSEVCLPTVPLKAFAWDIFWDFLFAFFFKVVNRDASLSKPMARSQEHLKSCNLVS